MFKSIICTVLLTLPLLAIAQSPVPQINGSCPTGTMKSGDYCIPRLLPGGGQNSYIVKSGNSCPRGYLNASDGYCMKGAGAAPESIPRSPGKDCPYQWYKSGDYCWKGAGAD